MTSITVESMPLDLLEFTSAAFSGSRRMLFNGLGSCDTRGWCSARRCRTKRWRACSGSTGRAGTETKARRRLLGSLSAR
eukprot:24202-Rhodomonas_salina.2